MCLFSLSNGKEHFPHCCVKKLLLHFFGDILLKDRIIYWSPVNPKHWQSHVLHHSSHPDEVLDPYQGSADLLCCSWITSQPLERDIIWEDF